MGHPKHREYSEISAMQVPCSEIRIETITNDIRLLGTGVHHETQERQQWRTELLTYATPVTLARLWSRFAIGSEASVQVGASFCAIIGLRLRSGVGRWRFSSSLFG